MFQITVLVSGSGSNLQSVIDAINLQSLDAKISMVIADRECYALSRATNSGISNYLIDRKVEKNSLSSKIDALIPAHCDLIILAGFLSILDRAFIQKWQNKIINIHPSLLPKFGGNGMWGMNVHNAVVASGEQKSGCSVHYVTEEVDKGEIILQTEVDLLTSDTAVEVQKKVQSVEGQTLVSAIKIFMDKIKCI